jgi:hypothetical protein
MKTIVFLLCLMLSSALQAEEGSCQQLEDCVLVIAAPAGLVPEIQQPCRPTVTPEVASEATSKNESEDEVQSGPKNWQIALFGVGMAPVEFLLSTTLHEGSHAMLVDAFGGNITSFKPYPHIGKNGNFYFGAVTYNNLSEISPGEDAWISAAPMILDTAVLGTYSVMSGFDLLPENKFARMGIIVFATGHWIDLLNHAISRNEFTDSASLRNYFRDHHGMNEVEANLVTRGPQIAVLAASGGFLVRDIVQIFQDDPAGPRRTRVRESMIPGVYNLEVAPSVSPTFAGFNFSGKF